MLKYLYYIVLYLYFIENNFLMALYLYTGFKFYFYYYNRHSSNLITFSNTHYGSETACGHAQNKTVLL